MHISEHSTKTRAGGGAAMLTLLVLLLGSVAWYKQRMLFIDPCWITYRNINIQSLNIAEYRYGAFITQVVPLIGSKLHLSLQVILIAYSASFYIFYIAVAWITGYCFRQYWLVILMACYFTFFVSDVYFWPNNEVHQGVAWMILFLGMFLHYAGNKSLKASAFLLLPIPAFLAVFSHFIVIIPLSFLWLYIILEKRSELNGRLLRATVLYTLLITGLFLFKYRLGTTNSWYDAGKLEPIKKMGIDTVLSSFRNGHARTMFPLFFSSYWIVIPVFTVGIAALLVSRRYLQLVLVLAYTVGYFSLLCLTYPDAWGRELLFYMESEWMALSIIIATPFVLLVLPRLSSRMAITVLVVLFVIRLCYIGSSFLIFNRRLTTLERITGNLNKHHINKAVFHISKAKSNELFLNNWGLPIESIMVSELNHYSPRITFKVVTDPVSRVPEKDSFFSCFDIAPVKEQDNRYFRIHPHSEYVRMTEQDMDRLMKQ